MFHKAIASFVAILVAGASMSGGGAASGWAHHASVPGNWIVVRHQAWFTSVRVIECDGMTVKTQMNMRNELSLGDMVFGVMEYRGRTEK